MCKNKKPETKVQDKNNSIRLQQIDNTNAQKLQDIFYPSFNKHTGEARYVKNY